MTLRRKHGLGETPLYDPEAEPDMVTIKLHHGGTLLRDPHTRYIGGAVDYYDHVDGNSLTIDVLRNFVGECRPLCDQIKTKFYVDDLHKGCRLLSSNGLIRLMIKSFKKDGELVFYVEHGDLNDVLRNEVSSHEEFSDNSDDSEFGVGDDSDGLFDEEYAMDDDDAMFDMNVENIVEEGGSSFNHSMLLSKRVHEGDIDILGSDDDGFNSDTVVGEDGLDESGLDSFPKYNEKIDGRKPNFKIGMLFSTRGELKSAIQTYSIKNSRDVIFKRNSTSRVRAVCKAKGCKWLIYACRLSSETCLQIRTCHLEHNCIPAYNNKTLTSTWLSKHYVKKFRNNPNYRAKDFRKEMLVKLGQHVSKDQAWRAKDAAYKAIYGSEVEQYGRLWDYCAEVLQTNPETTFYIKTVENEEGKPVFQRLYVCWAACKEGFKSGCRRIVGVDGCHLKNRTGGQLLVAVGIDPNDNIYPIAYAIVEVENKSSWEWFLRHLYEDIKNSTNSEDLYEDQYEWTFMSDKQKGLIEAFKTILPRVDHRFCVRHLHENFKRAGFKATSYKDALWSAATSTTIQYFKEAMKGMKKLDVKAFEWFSDKDPEQWSRAYFTLNVKCDILLNNMCEVFNSFVMDARDKPVLTLVSMVKDLICMRMTINREKAEKYEGKICPKPREKLLKCVKASSACIPMKCNRTKFQVSSGSTNNDCAVDLEKRTCSCRKWQLTGVPCKHACASIRLNGEDVEDYMDECYFVSTYKKVYGHTICPMSGSDLWPQTEREGPLPPPLKQKKIGRLKRLRKVNAIEASDDGKTLRCKVRKYLCKICKEQGHTSKTCKMKESTTADIIGDNVEQEDAGQFASQTSMQYEQPSAKHPKSLLKRRRAVAKHPPSQTFVPTQPGRVNIRVPPPMVDRNIPNSTSFKPPGQSIPRPPLVFLNEGMKFVNLNALQGHK